MKSEGTRFDRTLVRISCTLTVVALAFLAAQPRLPLSAQTTVTLNPSAAPTTAQPGVTVVNVTGSGFPSGTIPPGNVTVTLQPTTAGSGSSGTTVATAVTSILGTTKRVTFQIPTSISVTSPTPYQVLIAGSTSTGIRFSSSNAASLTINPPAQIVSLSPAWGQSGQTLSVTITALYTNFVQGATQASFGPQVSVGGAAEGALGAVTVISPTSATAQIVIDPATGPGFQTVSVQTGVQVASLTGTSGFRVAGQPVLVSVNPNTGQQGRQSLSVALTGQSTSWLQGTTTVSFGAGITVAALTVTSSTSALAVLNIDPTASTGPRNVVVTTGAEVATLNNGFTVTAGTPALVSANPASGRQGQQNLSVALTGQFTNWVQGTTTASFGQGITVTSLTVNSATSATAVLNIDPAAATGARTVALTTGSEVDTLANGFTVGIGTPMLLSVNPNSGQQGQQNLSVSITGQFTHFLQGASQANLGGGVTVLSLTVSSPTSATAVVNIDPAAATGARTVALTTGNEAATLVNGFTVTASTPISLAVSPNSGQQGQQNLQVAITGQSSHFLQGSTQASFGAGIAVVSLTVNSPTSATAILAIGPTAATGPRTVTVATGGEVGTLPSGFTVTAGTPVLLYVNPNSGQQGQQSLPVALVGQFTNWVQGTTNATFGAGIAVASLTVNSSTSATAVLNTDPSAAAGVRTVTLTTGSEVETLSNAFAVTASTPTLLSVSPNSGLEGQQNLAVIIAGQFTHFQQGASQASFGAGITVSSLTVNSATTAAAILNVDYSAAVGARTVTVTTGTEAATLSNGFTVTANTPAILSVSPNSGQQGQQNLAVNITGQFTHFLQGSTQASLGAGITVVSLTVNSFTSATAVLNIDSAAAPGVRSVTVTTGSEIETLNNGFTVSSPAIGITVSPNPVAFGDVPVTTSSTQTVTITSSGSTPLTVNSITESGAFFSVKSLPPLPLTLAPNSSASFNVAFAPQGTISSNATITILSNAATSLTLVQLTGHGIPAPQPAAAAVTVTTDQTVYRRAQLVQISGTVTSDSGSGISNVPVAVQVSINGTTRVFNPYTDAQGNYRTTFQPTQTEGGTYSVTATATSGGATHSATTGFRIFGLLISASSLNQDLLMGGMVNVPLNLQNIGDAALTNLTFAANVVPSGAITASFSQSLPTLAPGAPVTIPLVLTAPSGNPPSAPVSVVVSVSATDSVSGAVDPESSPLVITLRPAVSTLTLTPPSLSVGVNPGGSLTRRFQVQNTGYMPSNNSVVALQDPVTYNWVSLGNANLGNLAPGASQIFQVMINPPANLPLGNYTVLFNVSGGSNPLQGTINISVTQSTLGAVSFVVNDDTGAKVGGATVTVYNTTTNKLYQGVTASDGTDTLSGVEAGDYSYTVSAPSHDSGIGTVSVTANATAQVKVLLTYDVVNLSFTVTPTSITDQYTVMLNITYSTTLPKPALKVVPPNFNFSFFPADVPNGQYACSLAITNMSAFAEVRNVTVDASQLEIGQPSGQQIHVSFPGGASVYQVGTLAPQANTTVPCYATVDGNSVPTHSAGNIVVQGNYDFSLDGNLQQGTTTTNVPVSYTRPTDLSYQPINFIYDETNLDGPPTLIYAGASFVYAINSERAQVLNLLNPSGPAFAGHSLVAFTAAQGATSSLDAINANQGNVFWHTDFSNSKQSLLGVGDTVNYDISALDNGLTLTQAISAQIAANPAQALGMPMYLGFEGQWADRNSPDGYLIPVNIITLTPVGITLAKPQSGPQTPCLNPEDPGCQDPDPVITPPIPTIEGQIQIQIVQKLRLERQAFDATLAINALAPLNNAVASVKIMDSNGNDATNKFFLLVTSDPLGATHGGTVSGQTTVGWQLIPNAGAGGTSAQGTQYQVQATLNFAVNGTAKTATTQVVSITVLPSPKLTVAYAAPYVVMDGKDAKIRVTVQNIGYGPANNLTIQSMQPTVVQSIPVDPSIPSLTVGFTVTGSSSTADSSGYLPGNLMINFGNVAPGATVSGYWTLHVTRRGFLTSINSTFTHDDYQGLQLDPLVLPPTTTLVPAIGGTITSSTGQAIPNLTVALSQGASDQTDVTGEYYFQDLAAGSFTEQVADSTGKVWATQSVNVLAGQPTNFVDLVISNFIPQKGVGTVSLDAASLLQTYDGTPKSVTATTNPAGLSVIFTYNGSFIPPATAGSYNVVATIVAANYQGSASGTLTISPVTPVISWPLPAPIVYGTALSSTQLDATVTLPTSSVSSPTAAAATPAVNKSLSLTAVRTFATGQTASAGAGKRQTNKFQNPGDPPLPASLAFVSDKTGRNQIYAAQNYPLASPMPVTTAGAGQQESREPDWSHSGKIAYQFGAPGVRGIHTVNPDGTGDVQVTPAASGLYPCTDDRDPTWSPDGSQIAYACLAMPVGAAVPAETYRLWRHNNNGPLNSPTSESPLLDLSGSGAQLYAPAWSPDGDSIAFVKAIPGNGAEIARFYLANGGLVTLTKGGYTNFDPTWSPDSKKIAFSSTRVVSTGTLMSDGTNPSDGDSVSINGQAYKLKAAPPAYPYEVMIGLTALGTLTNLKAAINGEDGAGHTYGFGTPANPDVFVSFPPSDNFVVQASQAGDRTGITTTAASAHLTWKAGNLTIAPGGRHIFVMNMQCPEAQAGCLPAAQLTAGAGDDTKPAWSPDGSAIAFVSSRTGKKQIYLVGPSQPETTTNAPISDGTANDDDPAWNSQFVPAQSQLSVQVSPVAVSAGVLTSAGQPIPSAGTVTVKDSAGNPIQGATVTLVPPVATTIGTDTVTVSFAPTFGQTNGQGRFAFTAWAPAVGQSYQLQFTVTASAVLNGNSASASVNGTVDVLGLPNVATPQPPGGVSNQQRFPVGSPPFTPQQKALYYQLTAQRSQLALLMFSLTSWVEVTGEPLMGPFGYPFPVFEAYILTQEYYSASRLESLAQDPPDPNFTVVALPAVQPPPPIVATGGPLSPNTVKLMNQDFAVEAVILGYLQALQTSVNRYSTALTAGDLTSAGLQRDAILTYEDTLVSLFNSDAVVTQNLVSSFQQDSIPNIQLTAADVTTVQNQVAANGLPSDMIQTLQQLGASATDIATMQNSLIAAAPASLATDFFSLLQSEAQSSVSASGAFIVGARPAGPVPIAGNLVYTPPAGAVLNSGMQTLSVVFTPTDTTDYTTATATVPLVVAPLPATVTLDPASLTQGYDGTPKSVTATTSPANLSVSVTYTQNGTTVAAPTNVGSYSVTATVTSPNYAGTANGTLIITGAGGCVGTRPGLLSWWSGDGNTSDLLGANNPSGSNAVTFVPGVVGTGLTFGSGGYIDIPASPSLANQQFTWSAWARPDGPGPNNDSLGSVIVGQDIDATHAAAQLLWRATDNRFLFVFGDTSSELIISQDQFAPGQFYMVTGTYDGSTFSLYVNGNLEGQLADVKTIAYSSLTWTIGSTDSTLRGSEPRTWNGVIDEVQAFNRALSQAEIQAIYAAAGAGECRGLPTIKSVTPNSGQQGQQNLSVALTGQFTNWAQGSTTANFGAGVTVASLTVNAATSATAILNIDPAATPGPRTVTLTTGSEVDTLANGFTVTAAPPVLLSVNPGAAQQGQQATVTITGQFTNWVQGATTATFGPGINVASLTVNSPTSATAVLTIDPLAPTGASAVVMTTGSEVVTLNNGFTVIAGTPTLVSVTPNSGQQGQHLSAVSVTGLFTHFAQGTTTVSFGPGITVASLTVNSPTSAMAVLNISASAATGPRTATITTGTEVETLANGFTVTAGTPTLVSVSPASGQPGQQNISVVLTGQFTNWVQGTTTANFGPGITVTSLTVTSSTSAMAVLSANASAAAGAHTVTLTTGSEIATLTNGFTVTAGTPALVSVNPASGQQGQQNLLVVLTGQFTNWTQGTTTANFGAGITVVSLTVNSSTAAAAALNIGATAATGFRTVTMTTGAEIDTLTNGFTVTPGVPALVSVNPASGQQGQQNLSVLLTGEFTNWAHGTTTANFGAGITVVSLTVDSPSSAAVVLNIDPAAATGMRTVTLTTGNEVDTLTNGFMVSANACTSPPSGMVSWWSGDGNYNDIIGGNNGTSQNGAFAPGLVGQAFSLNEPGPVVAPYNCPTCAYVSITNNLPPSANAVTIDAWVYPDQSQQSQGSSQWVYTQYASGPQLGFAGTDTLYWRPNGDNSTEFSSPGIIPSNTWTFLAGTYDSASGLSKLYVNGNLVWTQSLSGPVSLTDAAFIGKRLNQEFFVGRIDELELYTRALSASEIQAIYQAGSAGKCKGQPAINSVAPNSGQQGQQNLSVALSGYFTNWAEGATTASFGPGITVTSLTVNSATSATAILNIDPAAATGARTVTLTTGSETETLTNGFTVTPATTGTPALVSVNPNSGQQGQQNLSVALTGQFTNWVQGTTTASFGAGITVASVTVNSATSATAVLNIGASAATGARAVTVTTGTEIEALANGFTVTAPVNTHPQIVSTNPANGASNVPTTAAVVVTFNEAIDPASVTTSTFYIVDYTTSLSVPGAVQADSSNTTATFTPSQPFLAGHSFSVTLTTAIKDTAGNNLAANFNFDFATGPLGSNETDSTLFSVLNTAAPSGSAANNREADALLFSVLNTAAPSGSTANNREADALLFSVLNTAGATGTGASINESDSIIFSVNNTAVSQAQLQAKHPAVHPPVLPDSDADGYPDALEIALGSDPNDPESMPVVQGPREVESIVFSAVNSAQTVAGARTRTRVGASAGRETAPGGVQAIVAPLAQGTASTSAEVTAKEQNGNQEARGESHEIKVIAIHRGSIFEELRRLCAGVVVHPFRGSALR